MSNEINKITEVNEIFDSLWSLMTRQNGFQGKPIGIPFVSSEATFGVTARASNEGLHATMHLIDNLNSSQFFRGDRAPNTHIETLLRTLPLGDTKIYDDVTLRHTENSLILTINTDRKVKEILSAIGTSKAQGVLDGEQEKSREFARHLRWEFFQESGDPLYDPDTDIQFVKTYIQRRVAMHFTAASNASVSGPFPATESQVDTVFADYGIVDDRPKFEVTLTQTEDNDYRLFSQFYNAVLGKVFTGPLALSPKQTSDTSDLSFVIKGNPSRLAHDIAENDSALAAEIARDMSLDN